MKILVVSQYFWPENFRVNDLCSELIKRGHEVTVLTSTPNYPKGRVFDEFKKNRESYTKFHGAEVIRVPQIPRGTSLFQLLLNYISFSFMATILGLFRLRKRNFDVIYLHQLTPIFSVIPGVIFGKIRKIPSVIWVLDIWPDALNIVGIDNKYIHSTIGLIVRQVYKNCHSILIQSRGFEQSILENGVNKEKIIYFPSWSEDIFLKSVGREEISPVRKLPLKLLFAGNVGDAQGFPFC